MSVPPHRLSARTGGGRPSLASPPSVRVLNVPAVDALDPGLCAAQAADILELPVTQHAVAQHLSIELRRLALVASLGGLERYVSHLDELAGWVEQDFCLAPGPERGVRL